jgi:osmotically-inducible protein OsmY
VSAGRKNGIRSLIGFKRQLPVVIADAARRVAQEKRIALELRAGIGKLNFTKGVFMKRAIKSKKKVPTAQFYGKENCTTAAVLNAIECVTTIPQDSLTVTVHEGWVRLEGILPDWSQKETVDNIVRHVPGVNGLISLIRVESQTSNPLNRGITL